MEKKSDTWSREQETLARYKSELGDTLFTLEYSLDSEEFYQSIGIWKPWKDKPKGYIKYIPFDFIVEEITQANNCVHVEDSLPLAQGNTEKNTYHITATKIAISTMELVTRLRETFSLPENAITYAGIKDAHAVTAQTLRIENVSSEELLTRHIPDIRITSIKQNKNTLFPGNLRGNRFTILVRTEQPPSLELFSKQIKNIEKEGMYNFYGPQRFGPGRFLNIELGKHILRGETEEFIKKLFIGESRYELPFFAMLRKKVFPVYGDWQSMQAIFQEFPHTFKSELRVLEECILRNPKKESDFIEILGKALPEEINLLIRAYASYNANLLLSTILATKNTINRIPLLISSDTKMHTLYTSLLKQDGTETFLQSIKKYPFVRISARADMLVKTYPTIHTFKVLPEGVVLSFDLDKGSYATTFLEELFTLSSGEPVPTWVQTTSYDTKKILGAGTLEKLIEAFSSYWIK